MVSSGTKYTLYTLWSTGLFFLSIYIFTTGFLLQRQVLPNQTKCDDVRCVQPPAVYSKAIILLVDALRYDFCVWNSSLPSSSYHQKKLKNKSGKVGKISAEPNSTNVQKSTQLFRNQLPAIHKYSQVDPKTGTRHGKLYKFLADPPTTTMQRLKGLTTGSLPTFIDVSANFASYQIQEDNFISQLITNNKTIYFSGDDTWTSLYPDSFSKSDPQPSFDVWDLDSVDTAVTKFLYKELNSEWDLMIGHFLGVDHAGHKFGPNHPEMQRKLTEMNSVIEHVVDNLPKDTVLMVFGDHGMTDSGDHGGDSNNEIEAGLFIYGRKLGFEPESSKKGSQSAAVSQVDLVPTLSLLLGLPIPYSNLGMLIEDIFIPTQLFKDSDARLNSYSKDDLIKFRMSYIKSNVNQVNRYLASYLAAGGHFPEKTAARLKKLASEVINRPGAMSPHETMVLYTRCKEFLKAAKEMCQSVWVNFDDSAITISLTFTLLHLTTLTLLLLCKPPQHRGVFSTFVTGFLLIYLGASLLVGSFFGASLVILGEKFESLGDWLPSSSQLMVGLAGLVSLLTNGMCLLWKLRYSVKDVFHSTLKRLLGLEKCASLSLFLLISISVVSNSFVIHESSVLSYCLVTLLVLHTCLNSTPPIGKLMVILSIGLIRLSCVYIRCREEHGPDCPLTQFHKPLSTLDNESSFYRNWRYFITLVALLVLSSLNHMCLSTAGNLNGLSCSVLAAKYLPGLISVMMASYWALQAFPSPLVSKLLPWQHNLLAHGVFALAILGVIILLLDPRLVYVEVQRNIPGRGQASMLSDPNNIPGYFNYMKTNWTYHGSLKERLGPSKALGYGLGTGLSAPVLSILVMFSLVSMLMVGDGQCPAVLVHFLLLLVILMLSAHSRLKNQGTLTASASTVEGLLHVPFSHIVIWTLVDSLTFFTTGHQATFPHIQWSAAFVGLEGTQLAGESYTGHILPAILVGWNTFSSAALSTLALPLLILAPFSVYLMVPKMRPSSPAKNPQKNIHENQETVINCTSTNKSASATANGVIINKEDVEMDNNELELDRGESLLFDYPEETRRAFFNLAIKFLVAKGFKVFCCMLAAAVLRRHLMVWKIFAPKFIFAAVDFMVASVVLILTKLVFLRVFGVVSASFFRLKIS